MSALATEIDHTLRTLDKASAMRLERLVREALDVVQGTAPSPPRHPDRDGWLKQLDALRATVGAGKQGTSTENILEDLRSDRY